MIFLLSLMSLVYVRFLYISNLLFVFFVFVFISFCI